ncbi:PfkB family carbohydrate kinase [Nocardioides speluncae]|uniref:PfkB family carbohydrate kinase n=1 Tax=Nocardioides speluncae TaxID=2670337 RepID=UPI000D69804C|nr:PfkB family carbohydrate kinase [Nocardioides speluncae]
MRDPARGSVLVLGESLVDVVQLDDGRVAEHPGGSPANVAVAMARLGVPVELATAFGLDRRGELIRYHLAANGVRLAGDPERLGRTSTAIATIDGTGAASYRFDVTGDLGAPGRSADRVHLHTGSIGALLEPGAAVVAQAVAEHATHATVSYDVNARPAVTGSGPELTAAVEEVVRRSDVVKASDEDLVVVYPRLGTGEAVGRLLALGAAAVVVTGGAAGAVCFTPGRSIEVPGTPVEVVDTIGAGDAFMAALLDGLWRAGALGASGRSVLYGGGARLWKPVLSRACAAAAISVGRRGADPPTRSELASRTAVA